MVLLGNSDICSDIKGGRGRCVYDVKDAVKGAFGERCY